MTKNVKRKYEIKLQLSVRSSSRCGLRDSVFAVRLILFQKKNSLRFSIKTVLSMNVVVNGL